MTAPQSRVGGALPVGVTRPTLLDEMFAAMESLPTADTRHWMQAYLLGWLAEELASVPTGPELWSEGLRAAVVSAERLS